MKRYAICGVSNRAIGMFAKPVLEQFSANHSIVALLDVDPRRFRVGEKKLPKLATVPEYLAADFNQMLSETSPDVLIVASRDDTHAYYVLEGLKHDLDVIVEKPMATTAADARKIIEAEKASKGTVTVTFNYRYSPIHTKIKELILAGNIGKVTSVDLNWYIDTYHGSSYFQRWNRVREYSGGLSVHKSSHHFDLVNWWINQKPFEVFAYGDLNYFGPEGAFNPSRIDGRTCSTCTEQRQCNYYTRWNTRSASEKKLRMII